MKNNDIGASFQKLLFDAFYRYRSYRALKRPDGTILVLNKIMTIDEFHQWVDDIYEEIDKSVQRAFNPIPPKQ